MDRDQASRLSCVVCRIETMRHAGWLLVMDNRWFDRVKILSWHPVLARQEGMQSVCCKQHLKTLLTHWLMRANLQFAAACAPDWPVSCETAQTDFLAGKVVAELAVERESRSRVWTGSAEALECILNALIGATENWPQPPVFPVAEHATRYSREYAFY